MITRRRLALTLLAAPLIVRTPGLLMPVSTRGLRRSRGLITFDQRLDGRMWVGTEQAIYERRPDGSWRDIDTGEVVSDPFQWGWVGPRAQGFNPVFTDRRRP